MKKINDLLYFGFALVVCFLEGFIGHFGGGLNNGQILLLILRTIVIVLVLRFFIWCAGKIHQAIHNMKHCDDPLFEKIDFYNKRWDEDNEYFKRKILIVNCFYRDGGPVDELVDGKEIGRLYARADFLEKQNTMFEFGITIISSVAISLIVSLLCQYISPDEGNAVVGFIGTIFFTALLVSVFALKYIDKGQMGSYSHFSDEYELSLLKQKIDKFEHELVIEPSDEKFLYTKQIVLNELIEIRKRAKFRKKEIEKDINTINALKLCPGNGCDHNDSEIFIKDNRGYLAYHKDEGKENNYVGELNLISKDFSILYQIMKKYELLDNENKTMISWLLAFMGR